MRTLISLAAAEGWQVVVDEDGDQAVLIDLQHDRTTVVHLPRGRVVSRPRDGRYYNRLAHRPPPATAMRGHLDSDGIAAVLRREVSWTR